MSKQDFQKNFMLLIFFFIPTRLYYLRADSLRDKQSIIKDKVSENKILQKESQEENNSNSDDSDYEEFFDWRAKKVSWCRHGQLQHDCDHVSELILWEILN